MKEPSVVHALTLERYRMGELPPEEHEAVRAALDASPDLRERLLALDASDAEILASHPSRPFAAGVERRLREDGRARAARPLLLAPALGLGLLLVVAVSLSQRGGLPAGAPTGDRMKGGGAPSLLLFRQGPGRRVERLDPGALARTHDVLQLAYQAGGRRYGVIVSVDGRGAVTRHLPRSGDAAGPLEANGPSLLQTAYRLDDAPRLERFYIVAADAPFPVALVEAAARRAAAGPVVPDRLDLDPAFGQASFELRKEK